MYKLNSHKQLYYLLQGQYMLVNLPHTKSTQDLKVGDVFME